MPLSEIHKKKRVKNYVVMTMIMLFVAMIWAIAMVKMANASGMPDRFHEQRTSHQENIDELHEKWWYSEDADKVAKEARAAAKGRADGMSEEDLTALAVEGELETLLDDDGQGEQEE